MSQGLGIMFPSFPDASLHTHGGKPGNNGSNDDASMPVVAAEESPQVEQALEAIEVLTCG